MKEQKPNDEIIVETDDVKQRRCYISESVKDEQEIEDIHRNVCFKEDKSKFIKCGGNYYCLFHLPRKNKRERFRKKFEDRIEKIKRKVAETDVLPKIIRKKAINKLAYDFRYVYFPEKVSLEGHEFEVAVDFSSAEFTGAVSFCSAVFFQDVKFSSTVFHENANFNCAEFDEKSRVLFDRTMVHKELSFYDADIKGYVYFEGSNRKIKKGAQKIVPYIKNVQKIETLIFECAESWLDLRHAQIDKPERITFHTVRLQPSWFINVDCKKFVFINCYWEQADGNWTEMESELKSMEKRKIKFRHTLLDGTCLQLAANQENVKNFNRASKFRFMALEARRKSYFHGFRPWTLHWWYFASSFYGESPFMATWILFWILAAFAGIFTLTNFQVCPKGAPILYTYSRDLCDESRTLHFEEAVVQSLATATFQSIEYHKPVSFWSEAFIILEKILAPLQAALLALAIRRKFMR
jgi:hypothetical protein